MCFQITHYHLLTLFIDRTIVLNSFQQIVCTNVGSHDQDCILEVNCTSLGICDSSIIQYLQQYVEDIRMCFLDLIKKYNGIRFSSDSFCQLSTFIVSNISRRSSDQSGHGIFLHVLTHIDTNHVVLIIKQALGKCLCKLCLTYTCRSKEQEGTDRFCRIFDTCFGTDDCFSYKLYTFILTDDTLMQFICKVKCLISLTLVQFCNRNTCPSGNDLCDLIICNGFMHKRKIFCLYLCLFLFQLFLQLWKTSILELCCLIQIVLSLSFLNLLVHLLDLLADLLHMLYGILLILPLYFLTCILRFQFCQFFLQMFQTLFT